MGRWEPNAHDRLQEAALELFHERGYDRTTVGEIAARAGLTERTYFRYFADKREVLFSGSAALAKLIVDAIAAAPLTLAPFDVVASALEATSVMFEDRRVRARARQALIVAHAELRERELIKLASLAEAIAASLVSRGVAEPVASLVAEAGIAIFRNAFERWVDDAGTYDLVHHVRATRDDLRRIASEGAGPPKKSAVRRGAS